jgi:hypothetical protein
MGFFRILSEMSYFSDREFPSRDESWNEKHGKNPTARWTFFAVDHGCAEGISVSKWTVEEVEDLERSESPVDRSDLSWENPWENGGFHGKTMGKP